MSVRNCNSVISYFEWEEDLARSVDDGTASEKETRTYYPGNPMKALYRSALHTSTLHANVLVKEEDAH